MSLQRTPPRTRSRVRMGSPGENQPIFHEDSEDDMMAAGFSLRNAKDISKETDCNINKLDSMFEMMKKMCKRIQVIENKTDSILGDNNKNNIENIESSQENHTIQYPVRLPKGGWLKNPFEELTFSGRNNILNPIKFLRKFERIAEHEKINEIEQAYFFGKCMRGEASQWYELYDCENINRIKERFKESFWGYQAQIDFKNKLYFGRYRQEFGSMTGYALNLARETKTLTPPMNDHEIIYLLREHFDYNVARELRPSMINSVDDMIRIIESIESERTLHKLQDNRNSTNNKRNDNVYAQRGNWQIKNYRGDNKENSFNWKRTDYEINKGKGVDIIELPQNKNDKPIKTSYVRDNTGRPENSNKNKRVACLTAGDNNKEKDSEDSEISDGETKNMVPLLAVDIENKVNVNKDKIRMPENEKKVQMNKNQNIRRNNDDKIIRVAIFSRVPENINDKRDDDEEWINLSDIEEEEYDKNKETDSEEDSDNFTGENLEINSIYSSSDDEENEYNSDEETDSEEYKKSNNNYDSSMILYIQIIRIVRRIVTILKGKKTIINLK